jgi:hypothetical protein
MPKFGCRRAVGPAHDSIMEMDWTKERDYNGPLYVKLKDIGRGDWAQSEHL